MAYPIYQTQERENRRQVAYALVDQGINLMPLGGNLRAGEEKKPLWQFLPKRINKKGELKPSWKALMEQGQTTKAQVDIWLDAGASGFAVFGGDKWSNGAYIFDFDVVRLYDAWSNDPRVKPILDKKKPPIQMTGSGKGFQLFSFLDGEVKGNVKYAYALADNEQGREIAIESRGQGGYGIAPCSRHPSGNLYELVSGDISRIPTLTSEEFAIFEDVAKGLCEAPQSKRQIERAKDDAQRAKERAERRAKRAAMPESENFDHGDVITMYNDTNEIADTLEKYGYTAGHGGRMSRPNANSGNGVIIFEADNTSFHHSSNDELNDGHTKTPFSVYLHFEHKGDITEAVRTLAKEYGIDHASKRQANRQARRGHFDERHVLPSPIDLTVPAWFAKAPSPHAHMAHATTSPTTSPTTTPPHNHIDDQFLGYDPSQEFEPDFGQHGQEIGEPPTWHASGSVNEGVTNVTDNQSYEDLLAQCAISTPTSPTLEPDMLPIIAPKRFSWPKYMADEFITLAENQYVSDVFNFNIVPMGQDWGLQSGTGTGKTTAVVNQVQKIIVAVPLVGQVKNFVNRFGGHGIYEGQPMNINAQRYFTTYDSAVRLVSEHRKENIDLSQMTLVIDEAHHVALDGFKESKTFAQLLELVGLCGRTIVMSGTMSPLDIFNLDKKIEIMRPMQIKKLVSCRTDDLAHTLLCLRVEHKNHMLDVHLNDKKAITARMKELKALDSTLTMLAFTKQTEEDEAAHHMRVLNGDGRIAENVDIIFRTSIIDDGIDIFIDKPVISMVVSNVTPLTIEQAGARFRDNLPKVTYSMRLSLTAKEKADKLSAKIVKLESQNKDVSEEKERLKLLLTEHDNDFFHMEREYKTRVEKAERALDAVNALIDLESDGDTVADKATLAQKILSEEYLRQFEIIEFWKEDENGIREKTQEITVNKIKILQSVTKRWGFFCKRHDDALDEALSGYGYELDGFKVFESGKGVTNRKKKRRADKKALKEEENERIKSAVRSFESMTDVQAITIGVGKTKKKSEEHKAADIVERFHDVGLTFESSKEIIEGLTSFHGRTIGNIEKALNASLFFHAIVNGQAEKTPSGLVLAHLYKWLYLKKKSNNGFTSIEWAEEIFKATMWAGDDIARGVYFDPDTKEKALKDRRGKLLSSMASLGDMTTIRQGGQKVDVYSVASVPRFSDSQFRDGLSYVVSVSCDDSKTPIITKKNKDFTIVKPSNFKETPLIQSQIPLKSSENDDDVSEWFFDDDQNGHVEGSTLSGIYEYLRYL